jgi:hypothetical protein
MAKKRPRTRFSSTDPPSKPQDPADVPRDLQMEPNRGQTSSAEQTRAETPAPWSPLSLATTCLVGGLKCLEDPHLRRFGAALLAACWFVLLHTVSEFLKFRPLAAKVLGTFAIGLFLLGAFHYVYMDTRPLPELARPLSELARSEQEFKVLFYNGVSEPDFSVNNASAQPVSYSSGLATFRAASGTYAIRADYPDMECVVLVSVPTSETFAASCRR